MTKEDDVEQKLKKGRTALERLENEIVDVANDEVKLGRGSAVEGDEDLSMGVADGTGRNRRRGRVKYLPSHRTI